jgi:hypothetical protein
MRRLVPLLAVLGGLLFAGAVGWGYAVRGHGTHAGVSVLLVLAALACLGATALFVVAERRPDGLVVPAEWQDATHGGRRLPDPAWWAPVGLTGLALVAGGALASPVLGIVGVALVAVGIIGLGLALRREDPLLDRRSVVAARRISDFGRRHAVDGDARVEGALEHVGRGVTRVVLVGRDGAFGDVVVGSPERAALVAELAGVELHEPQERALGAQIRTGSYEWERMAGIQLGGAEGRSAGTAA